MPKKKQSRKQILKRAAKIKLLLTDCDGVLTDTGTFYTVNGEEMKRFSIRDGMGVERLRKYANVETGVITGEKTEIVRKRAEKLKMTEIHLGINYKDRAFKEIIERKKLKPEEVAFIGDDSNDVTIMKLAGLTACPADATRFASDIADIKVENKGGYGAFRDFAEIIIEAKTKKKLYRKDDDESRQS
jgi:3-deoxy-D-manno-octulosonate 8-phosphate phosphatase (KDO 8-P phosphatase)